ncbi:MAG: asparagine synthase, partial [Pyrinomonadaceae bacterium]|nr:asparagine synthase [Pyrinomonadaceae bacterium]
EDVLAQLDELLRDAVGKLMIADVPLGAFLSGGTDSSLVVALMQAQSPKPVKTFSIGFHESEYNEAEHAKAVAGHLGTDHTELYVSAEEAINVIPQLPVIYDEPFADSSQIPTYLISSLARREVTVSLSGDVGDELFGGYGRYFLARRLWHDLKRIPRPLREVASTMLRVASAKRWKSSGEVVSQRPVNADSVKTSIRAIGRHSNLNQKLNMLGEVIAAETSDKLYTVLISHWKNAPDVVVGENGRPASNKDSTCQSGLADFTERMMCLDAVTYLPDDILVKLDRASMAASLEARAPLLDYRVVEFAWKVPMRMKIRNQDGKWLLRRLLSKYVPREITERPKMGFDVPIAAWLRGPLRDWTEALLDERRLAKDGFFRAAPIRQKWREHSSGARNWQHQLWCILMFQEWLSSQQNS